MSCKKLLFIYDKLLTNREQEVANLNLKFISFAEMHGKLYWVSDSKKRRVLAIPNNNTTALIHGGLFLCEDYDNNKHKLHSYYNNSIPYTGSTMIEDLYQFSDVQTIPIQFSSLKDIENCNVKKGEIVECSCFTANLFNPFVNRMLKKRYHKAKNVDVASYINFVKEVMNARNQ